MDRREFLKGLMGGAAAVALAPALAYATVNGLYDIFVYVGDDGEPRLATGPAWSEDTDRGEPARSKLREQRAAYVGSVYYKSGDDPLLYLHSTKTVSRFHG